ncbi:hypothetical protein GGI04_004134 [Coemansia thaxteri]|uniref:Choline/carnitine acyltransferase domain-containing protein n=1 Tax=Coemansia thaxteri TaxID=2663907 RepID=A0A9W8BAV5_9FUNG|nr:hypothetical protein H4R26_005359 [Coemansia thaxteri]KAJ2000489.1 hypothetical protein GGI04_004134 [Coemansia thaxteri]KAJ2467915.1 hypothetical protein GGI02_003866 [Coemansia sp. RSA 2322]KAJ2477798.1 hypothetical protein EV174_004504 [Coemansia sp. RSA 2320]
MNLLSARAALARPGLKLALRPAQPAAMAYSTASPGASLGTFSNQDRLPRLPIPTLTDTATRYLKSLRPLLSTERYSGAERAVSLFIKDGELGPVLQRRLEEADRQAPYSWLEDIWLKKAYLEWRDPSYINVNWFAFLADNPDFALVANAPRGRPTGVQIARAARVITHMLEANEALNQQAIPADVQRDAPLCMNQYKWQFGTTRIPRPGCDELVNQYPSTAKHILVMYRNQTVEVPVYNSAGQRANIGQITAQLVLATERIDTLLSQVQAQPPVANLTAGHRDDWTKARAILEQDAANRESLAKVDTSLFGVCLDVDVDPQDTADAERSIAVFNHSDAGANRWFDKSIQLVIMNSGRLGVNCEHTPVDALTTGRLLMEVGEKERGPVKDSRPCAGLAEPTPIQWNVCPEVAQVIEKVRSDARALAGNLRILLGQMDGYGAQWIKTLGVSPDAYFQVALQTAYYRHYGQPTPTYESSSLRKFLHGRTETIRSCTEESLAFSKAFSDPDVSMKRKLENFQRAIAAHVELSKAAAAGKGVDRHLLGLRVQIRSPEEAERAWLFTDDSYVKSMSFGLSTSNVTPGERFRGGFAPVILDGYGVNYALDKADLKFSVSEWLSSSVTDAPAFRQTLQQTLADLYEAGEYAKSRQ